MRVPPLSRSALVRAALLNVASTTLPSPLLPPAFATTEAAAAPAGSYAVGYYEMDLPVDAQVSYSSSGQSTSVRTSVWAPLPESYATSASAVPTGTYRSSGSAYDALLAYTPFPPWLCEQLAGSAGEFVQVAEAVNCTTAEASRQKPRGAILMAHGLAATRLDFAPLAEALARRGFVVAAPDFADSYLRAPGVFTPEILTEGLYITSKGSLFRDTALTERAATLEAVAERLRRDYGEKLPFGMFGFSLGGDSIQRLGASDTRLERVPKVYVASPVNEPTPDVMRGRTRRSPSGPTLQILGVGGKEYTQGDTFVPTYVALRALPAADRKQITVDYANPPTELPGDYVTALFENAGHMMLSGTACDFKLAAQPKFSPDTRYAARTGAHVPCLAATVQMATNFFDREFA